MQFVKENKVITAGLAVAAVLAVAIIALLSAGGEEKDPVQIISPAIKPTEGPLPAMEGEITVSAPGDTFLYLTPEQAEQVNVTTTPPMILTPVKNKNTTLRDLAKTVPSGERWEIPQGVVFAQPAGTLAYFESNEGEIYTLQVSDPARLAEVLNLG